MTSEGALKPDVYLEDEVLKYILSALDSPLPMTLRDIYGARPKYPWAVFMQAVNLLISEGFIQGKGDSFVVHYSLTSKGQKHPSSSARSSILVLTP